MKKLIDKILISLSLFTLVGCSSQLDVAPSKNDALNSVSSSSAKKENSYFLQDQLDYFVDDELRPVLEKDETIQEKYMDREENTSTGEVTFKDKKNTPFTLQEIADKVSAYMDANPSDHTKSNVTRMSSMPGIGSTRKR